MDVFRLGWIDSIAFSAILQSHVITAVFFYDPSPIIKRMQKQSKN